MKDTADLRGMADRLQRDVARLDALLSAQVNAILHHPRFQRLEGSWRGLRYLVDTGGRCRGREDPRAQRCPGRRLPATWSGPSSSIRASCSARSIAKSSARPAASRSALLLGDYEIRPRPSAEHPLDDIAVLAGISAGGGGGVRAVRGRHASRHVRPGSISPSSNSRCTWRGPSTSWSTSSGRPSGRREDSRFVGLTLAAGSHAAALRGRRLARGRIPFPGGGDRAGPQRISLGQRGLCLRRPSWSGPSPSPAGWPASAASRATSTGGGLRHGSARTLASRPTSRASCPKCSTDVMVADCQEQELSELGFIPLCHCEDTELLGVLHEPVGRRSRRGTMTWRRRSNARISAMLQYMLCVSRFRALPEGARCATRSARLPRPSECEEYLHKWLQQYVVADRRGPPGSQGRVSARARRASGFGNIRANRAAISAWPTSGRISSSTELTATSESRPNCYPAIGRSGTYRGSRWTAPISPRKPRPFGTGLTEGASR